MIWQKWVLSFWLNSNIDDCSEHQTGSWRWPLVLALTTCLPTDPGRQGRSAEHWTSNEHVARWGPGCWARATSPMKTLAALLPSNWNAADVSKDARARNSDSKFSSFRVFPRVSTKWPERPNYFSTVQEDYDDAITSRSCHRSPPGCDARCSRPLLLYWLLHRTPVIQEMVKDHEEKVKIYSSTLFLIRQLFKTLFPNKQKLGP